MLLLGNTECMPLFMLPRMSSSMPSRLKVTGEDISSHFAKANAPVNHCQRSVRSALRSTISSVRVCSRCICCMVNIDLGVKSWSRVITSSRYW